MTEWTDDGRPAAWVTEVEPEFDVNERDSWYALDEFDRAICPDCGNLVTVCSSPEGLHGDGYHPRMRVCYVTAAREAVKRRYARPYKSTDPDENGFHPLDGVALTAELSPVAPEDDPFAEEPTSVEPAE